MANEYMNLQKHINERAQNLLTQAKSFEEMNRNKIISGIVEGANAEIDRVWFSCIKMLTFDLATFWTKC